MRVLVIIVTYNGAEWIERCIDSVINSQLETPAKIFIVDNNSTDETISIIERKYLTEFPERIILEKNDRNLGFGGANNIGIQYAIDNNYDYIYLLNQDAWIESNAIARLIEHSIENPNYGVLSPLQTNAEKSRLDGNFESRCSEKPSIIEDFYAKKRTKHLHEVTFVMAAHWLIPRRCFTKIGLFSPIFFHYGEDDNYLHRTKYHGFKIGVATDAIGVHDRESRVSTREKEAYMLYVRFLVLASDINRPSHFISFFKSYKKLIRLSVNYAIKYRDFSLLPKSISSIKMRRKIKRDREQNIA